MRSRYVGTCLLATALVVSLLPSVAVASPPPAKAPADEPSRPCADMTAPEENHASIRLRVDVPAADAQAAVDEHGKITIGGILHKHATMVDVSDHDVVSSDFVLGPPPGGVAAWAVSWTTSLRPSHLGANTLCVRAKRDPKRSARILRSFTVVDLIPPGAVPGLSVSDITATGAKATWGAAIDNYGLAGYAVSVDGGPAHRTTVGTRSYTITGLAPSTHHTVSVVAIDLAGNASKTPATASFTTAAAPPPPPPPGNGLTFTLHEGTATAVWHPDPADVTYRILLDGAPYTDFPLDRYCVDANGNPAGPCTPQDTISYPVEPLDEGTPYTFQVDALRADGTVVRSLSGSFTTLATVDTVPPAVVQQIASESSQCAGSGGAFYVSPSVRGRVPLPAGSTALFDGCYTVANNSCMDKFLPPSGDKLLDCNDDVTGLLRTVAPAGRGPVISSLDGVVDYGAAPAAPTRRDPVKPLVESATLGVHDDACTAVIEAGAELVHVAGEAAVAEAGVSFLVVIGEGIILGVALFALLEILFPTPISFAGLNEYPIHYNTNFDTFDNWGGEHGKWLDSLKIFAQMVKTTNQLAAKYNIPFLWDALKEFQIKNIINSACTAQQNASVGAYVGCGHGFAVYVPGAQNYKFQPMPQTGQHIVDAMSNGSGGFPTPDRVKWFYPARSQKGALARKKYARDWYDREPFKSLPPETNPCPGRPGGNTCDEFPFWATDQAVDLSGTLADLRVVPNSERDPQRDDIAGFYGKCKVKDTERFLILPMPAWVAANGPSFGFRVDPDGTSLCMEPKPATSGGP
jgi:hypothetical protein